MGEGGETGMKIKSIIRELSDDRSGIEIIINGEMVFDVFEDEPEDMKMCRTLKDCLKAPDLLRLAYEAGKNGEDFEVERIDEERP
jgi:hypothetical protein